GMHAGLTRHKYPTTMPLRRRKVGVATNDTVVAICPSVSSGARGRDGRQKSKYDIAQCERHTKSIAAPRATSNESIRRATCILRVAAKTFSAAADGLKDANMLPRGAGNILCSCDYLFVSYPLP